MPTVATQSQLGSHRVLLRPVEKTGDIVSSPNEGNVEDPSSVAGHGSGIKCRRLCFASKEDASDTVHACARYKQVKVDGLSIFYRETGNPSAPAPLLLHGFPSSSRMFGPLLGHLCKHYHLIAPDYPGFGLRDAPTPDEFSYTFDNIARVVEHFTNAIGLTDFARHMQDYGGPVGFRIATAHPEKVRALIIQNAVAHQDGLGPLWVTRRAFWADRQANEVAVEENLMSFNAARQRHVGSNPNVESFNPDLWGDEFAFLSRPGEREIQSDLFYDYQTNVRSYPEWESWPKRTQPPTLVVWARYAPSFSEAEAQAYRRDLPHADIHVIDTEHFALDEKADEIALLIRRFLTRNRIQ